MRIVLVGGGVIALLTAVECLLAGHRVVLVDQADIPFSGATSFDRHRVIRLLHRDDPAATAAATRAEPAWARVEQVLATSFYERVGALTVLPAGQVPAARAQLERAGVPASALGSEELAARWPQVSFAAGAGGVLESGGGVLLADRVLAACTGWLRWHPNAELFPCRAAAQVDARRRAVRLADGTVLVGDAVLVAVGPWSRGLLPELADRLVLRRQSMLYLDPPNTAVWAGTPPMLGLGDGGAWLVPPVAGTPLKLSASSACRIEAEVGDNRTAPYWRDHLLGVLAGILPASSPEQVFDTRDCHYLELAGSGGPLLAELGDRVLSFAACGGSSFKFAPLIARSLADRLTGAVLRRTGIDRLDLPVARRRPDPVPRGVS